jgi:hypothetical protein
LRPSDPPPPEEVSDAGVTALEAEQAYPDTVGESRARREKRTGDVVDFIVLCVMIFNLDYRSRMELSRNLIGTKKNPNECIWNANEGI